MREHRFGQAALAVVGMLVAGAGWGQPAAGAMPGGQPHPGGALQQPQQQFLTEMKGVVSWKTLSQVETVKKNGKLQPEFGKDVAALNSKEVRLQGFMMPLEMGDKQKRFLLTSVPPSCAFCMPGGPEQMIEVVAKTAVKYGFEPVILSGRFAVLADDPTGLYYRLTDAVPLSQ